MEFSKWLENHDPNTIPDGYRGVMFLFRGTSGSGKSYTALKLANGDDSKIFSADKWFDIQPGGYEKNWKVENLSKAHRWAQWNAKNAMAKGISPVIIDNTNIRRRDARPYFEMAKRYQYYPEIRESESPWWDEITDTIHDEEARKKWAKKLAHGFEYKGKIIKNTHNVSEESILKMLNRYHPYRVEDIHLD